MGEPHRSIALDVGCTSAEADLWSVIGDAIDAAPGESSDPMSRRDRRRFRKAVAVYVSEREAGRASITSLARILDHIHHEGAGVKLPPEF